MLEGEVHLEGPEPLRRPGWLSRRKLKKAISLFEQMLASNPTSWSAMWALGKIYQRMGDDAKALEWFTSALTGTGLTDRQFGPSDYMTQGMMTSPDVAIHRQNFIDQGGGTYGPTGVWFGRNAKDGPFEAGFNMPRQFVGSFEIMITEKRNGDAMFVIDNATTLKSLLYQIPGVQPVERSTMAPLSNKTQTFFWIERGVIKRP